MAWHKCGIDSNDLITNVPLFTIPAEGAGGNAISPYEHTVNLGTGFTKVKAILAYYGPGATSGQTLGGAVSFSINGNEVTLSKASTQRNEPLAKALEYWSATIPSTLDVQTISGSFSGYNFNPGTRISLTLWLLK